MEDMVFHVTRRKPRRSRLPLVLLALLGLVLFFCIRGCRAEAPVPNEDTESTQQSTESVIELTLLGDANMVVEYATAFEDPGVIACVGGLQIPVQVEGTVNPQILGNYTLTYLASHEGISKRVDRKVTVVDTTAPEITLVSNPEHYTIPGEEYEEEGYSAFDGYDGDLTGKVQWHRDSDEIVYTVSDSSGNETQVRRQIRYHDPVHPVLNLVGESTVIITAGDSWTEPGYTASDNLDGNLTQQVKVTGGVDVNTAGTYVLKYEVVDSYGNKTTAVRTVVVEKRWQPQQVKPNGKVIYLTFDDGPWENTDQLLSVLEKYGVKATFFVVNNTKYLHLLKDMADGGHTVAIHSKTHRYQDIYANDEAFLKDLYDMQKIIQEYTGTTTTVMRFPGGSSNGVSKKYNVGIMSRLVKTVESLGFQYFDWNVDSDDAGSACTWQQVYQNVVDGVKQRDYSVVLMHDTRSYTIEAIEKIIQWGLDNGYSFMPLDATSPTCHHGWMKN